MTYKSGPSGVHGRLDAPPASIDCLSLQQLHAFQGESAELINLLKGQMKQADQILAARFWEGSFPVAALINARAWAVEQLLLKAWRHYIPEDLKLSLLALGGFGRGELHPHSDIDLLVLVFGDFSDEELKAVLEPLIGALWEAGFFLGHSVRSISQALEDAREDVKFATNLMESRLITGPQEGYWRLHDAIWDQSIWPADTYFHAKYQEQLERHSRYHDTGYNLEPNVKEGPGGLRDIQMISWTAKRHYRVHTLHGLVEKGYLTESLYSELMEGQSFLWRVRFGLHLLAGRAKDRLLFDHQRKLAEKFSYPGDVEKNEPVEAFMQSYFRTITTLERLNDQLLERLEEALQPEERQYTLRELGDGFYSRSAYLVLEDRHLFLDKPETILLLFRKLQQHPELKGVSAETLRLLQQNLFLMDGRFRNSAKVNGIFLQILRHPKGVYTQLQRMNRWGVLARLVPVFLVLLVECSLIFSMFIPWINTFCSL